MKRSHTGRHPFRVNCNAASNAPDFRAQKLAINQVCLYDPIHTVLLRERRMHRNGYRTTRTRIWPPILFVVDQPQAPPLHDSNPGSGSERFPARHTRIRRQRQKCHCTSQLATHSQPPVGEVKICKRRRERGSLSSYPRGMTEDYFIRSSPG